MKNRHWRLLAMTGLVLAVFAVEIAAGEAVPSTSGEDVFLDEHFAVAEDFDSHLPIVLVDFDRSGMKEGDEGVQAVLASYHGKTPNRLTDPPALEVAATVKSADGQFGGETDKRSYGIALRGGAGEAAFLPEMKPEREWQLKGSNLDRTLIRNAVAFSIASAVLARAPEFAFCEVVFREGGVLRYQGIYLATPGMDGGVLLADAIGNKVEYVAREVREDDDFSLVYPPADPSGAAENLLRKDVKTIGDTLSSSQPAVYFGYRDLLDVESFVDCWLVREILADHLSVSSWYMRRTNGRVEARPLWEFDRVLDNAVTAPEETENVAAMEKWFSRLLAGKDFLVRLHRRFLSLQRAGLRPERLDRLVDGIAASLGPALARDRVRWRHPYFEDERWRLRPRVAVSGGMLIRETDGVVEELIKIKHHLRRNGASVKQKIASMRYREDLVVRSIQSQWEYILFFLLIGVFFMIVHYSRRW